MSPKDNRPQVQPIESPSGLELHPEPEKSPQVSRRAAGMVVGVIAAILLAYAYGGYRRTERNQAEARQAGLPKTVAPATQAEAEFVNEIPMGSAPFTEQAELQPPVDSKHVTAAPCGADPRIGAPYRYNPQTGRPCNSLSKPQPTAQSARPMQPKPVEQPTQPTPEEQALALAYEREQQAILSPTSTSTSASHGFTAPMSQRDNPLIAPGPDISQILSRTQAGNPTSADAARGRNPSDDYEAQNMQSRKEGFQRFGATQPTDDYLRSFRTAPISLYEIRAGWEIPAALEQSLNSDLPGELKSLVTSNVHDTATGNYLLIPQGSRLIGQYDSRISYGQDGVQVIWNRIVFPDASSIDLNGIAGLDSHGNAGLRDKVDRHYRRLIGFSALTSLFTAAFAISQYRNESVLVNPSVGQITAGAVGQQLSETGDQITRRNLNVQPTIKVPAGYRFTVRVNRDIIFDSPYEAVEAAPAPATLGH